MAFFDLIIWAMVALSLFNAMVLIWLGLTVLVNAERRGFGACLAGGGMLLGGAVFLAHTAALNYSLESLVRSIGTWWGGAWIALLVLPGAWYGLMLWCCGYWDDRDSLLHRRHRLWLALAGATALGLTVLLLWAEPQRLLRHLALLILSSPAPDVRATLLAIAYPVYLLGCIGLSLDALWRPAPSGRLMGDLARRRARPWLVATTGLQLAVSLMTAGAILWVVIRALHDDLNTAGGVDAVGMEMGINGFDFAVCLLIAMAVVCLGKAVVSYEIFTGKTLPRQGFSRQWRFVVIVAASYSALVAAVLIAELPSIFGLLLTTTLMSAFLAIFTMRAYAEREQSMLQLRPFVASQNLYEHLLVPPQPESARDMSTHVAAAATDSADAPFEALCLNVLSARRAHLVPLGSMSALAGPPLHYTSEDDLERTLPPLESLLPLLTSQHLCVPLAGSNEVLRDVDSTNGASSFSAPRDSAMRDCSMRDVGSRGLQWAVPLWSERGLIGVLLLGARRDNSLYSHEEIEIARAACERLLDARAGSALAGRLMALQQQRLAETQVLDRRARRTLHDDILPLLHAAMLTISSASTTTDSASTPHMSTHAPSSEALASLAEAHRRISDLLREMPPVVAPQIARLGLCGALRRMTNDELHGAFDSVQWQVEEAAETALRELSPLVAEVVFYAAREAMRNAARYGRGAKQEDAQTDSEKIARPLSVSINAKHLENTVEIAIEDDGVGLQADNRLQVATQADKGGSGHGLILHSTMMAVVGGALGVQNGTAGQGTRVVLTVPIARN